MVVHPSLSSQTASPPRSVQKICAYLIIVSIVASPAHAGLASVFPGVILGIGWDSKQTNGLGTRIHTVRAHTCILVKLALPPMLSVWSHQTPCCFCSGSTGEKELPHRETQCAPQTLSSTIRKHSLDVEIASTQGDAQAAISPSSQAAED